MHRRDRMAALFGAGLAESFGMALGWTTVLFAATDRGGLAEAAVCNAAMLGGVVLSAPAAGYLARRLAGRALLQLSVTMEMLLRTAVLTAVWWRAPVWLLAVVVVALNVAGWVLFAGMRAEVIAVDASPRSITRYAVGIAGVEAAGTAAAALLPSRGLDGWLAAVVWLIYPASLVPTVLVARRSRIRRWQPVMAPRPASRPARPLAAVSWPSVRLLAAGGAVMMLAAGPALLVVPITEQLFGGVWVAGAAVAFCAGTLLSSRAVTALTRRGVPALVRWPLWGIGMLAGWILAPVFAPMVLVAQFAAGLSQAALEGDMDNRVAATAGAGRVTRDLAYAGAARALGGAICVRALPTLIAVSTVGVAAACGVAVLVMGALLARLAANICGRATTRFGVVAACSPRTRG